MWVLAILFITITTAVHNQYKLNRTYLKHHLWRTEFNISTQQYPSMLCMSISHLHISIAIPFSFLPFEWHLHIKIQSHDDSKYWLACWLTSQTNHHLWDMLFWVCHLFTQQQSQCIRILQWGVLIYRILGQKSQLWVLVQAHKLSDTYCVLT